MYKKIFESNESKDIIDIEYNQKTHCAIFKLVQIDKVIENIKLVGEIMHFLKEMDIKWVITSANFNFEVPGNMVWFRHKYSKDIHCHIEDFEQFYLKNMYNFIKCANIYIQSNIDENGWTEVVDTKKKKNDRIRDIKKEIDGAINDWSKPQD